MRQCSVRYALPFRDFLLGQAASRVGNDEAKGGHRNDSAKKQTSTNRLPSVYHACETTTLGGWGQNYERREKSQQIPKTYELSRPTNSPSSVNKGPV